MTADSSATSVTWFLSRCLADSLSQREFASILAVLSAAACRFYSLTSLLVILVDEQRQASRFAVCASLARLTGLKDLALCVTGDALLAPGDGAALQALTNLTFLGISEAAHGVGSTSATALACSLRQLQCLELHDCQLQLGTAEGRACLEACGRLPQLTRLDVTGNPGLTRQGLMQLTGLSHLKEPDVECDNVLVTAEVLRGIWSGTAAVPGH
jgi:hypothetical protein